MKHPEAFATIATSGSKDSAAAEAALAGDLKKALQGKRPSVILLFATSEHAAAFSGMAERLGRAFDGVPVVGGSTTGISSRHGESADEPAIGALAVCGITADSFLAPDLTHHSLDIGRRLGQSFAATPSVGKLLLLMPDSYVGSFEPLIRALTSCYGPHPLVGGAPSEKGLGRTFQWGPTASDRDKTRAISGGLSGVFLSGEFDTLITVAQGCSPVGAPLTVTEATGNVVISLDNKPALEAFISRLPGPLKGDLPRAMSSVLFAIDTGEGMLTRHVIALEADSQGLVFGEPIAEGTKVRLAIRDAVSARDDMKRELEALKTKVAGRRIICGVYFTCSSRGPSLYGMRDIDTSYIDGALGNFPWIGMETSAEIAQLGGALHVFAYTGVLALIVER
ncbi:MAG: FIST C-terminal domain-containing protein [Deltaproteobacteria bacterium]|nr:FIST C-terminal domain-containing protein [Deltaproteobacteria bacterium]